MALAQGTKVLVIGGGPLAGTGDFHAFPVGNVVEAVGQVYPLNPVWELFKSENGDTTWMKTNHYKVVAEATQPEVALPTKAVYVVMKNGEIHYMNEDRDIAREVKSCLGGKAKGAVIFAYTASKEIR